MALRNYPVLDLRDSHRCPVHLMAKVQDELTEAATQYIDVVFVYLTEQQRDGIAAEYGMGTIRSLYGLPVLVVPDD